MGQFYYQEDMSKGMSDNTNANTDGAYVTMEISGPYSDVISKLSSEEAATESLGPLLGDIETLLETVARINGGTRSAIANNLPSGTARDFDGEAVAETMQVLERYDLVVLEGNTWKLGPDYQD